MIDIILYHDNLKETLDFMFKIGWKKVIVLFEIKSKKDLKKFEKINEIDERIYPGILIKEKDKRKLKDLAAEAYYNKDLFIDFIVYEIQDYDSINYISRIRFFNGICKFEFDPREDFITHRRSGINHVIAKKLKENEIAYIIPISYINNFSNKSLILGRIFQNIKLQRKYKFDIIISSFAKEKYDVKSPESILAFARILKIENPESVIKENIIKQIEKTRKAKAPWVFTKGFEIVKFPYEDSED